MDILVPYMELFFNILFDSSFFPDAWNTSIIVTLFKKGNTKDPNNYRGISLLSTFSKLYTSILNNRLTFWAESYEKIVESQAGFRKGYSTTDNIFILQSVIQRYISRIRGKLYAVFVDFRKAFDFVYRTQLWSILKL